MFQCGSLAVKYIRKAYEMWKERGFVEASCHIFDFLKENILKISLESYYVFEKDLDANMKMEKSRIDLDVVRLNKQNYISYIDALIGFWPDYFRFNRDNIELKKDIVYYFQCGDECFVAMHNEKIVAMEWCGHKENYMIKTVGKKIGLKEDEVILHRLFVNEEYRGNNIHPFLSSYIKNLLHMNNIKKIYGYVGTSNMIAILSNMKMNDRCRFIYHVQIVILGFSVNLFPKFPKTYLWEK